METVCRDQMVARADAYRILAAFMNLPTQDFNQSLQDGSMMLSWQAIIPHLSWSEESARDAETILSEYANEEPSSLEQLRIEYTRLFSHPDHPVVFPYEAQFLFSHALDDADKEPVFVINKIALDVDEAYQNAGYQRPRGKVISSDYLGTELSFVALL
ncbi:MAG: molecular chaperone TorD family protein, partial [Raoultibacter sp.]